jgi:NitT/TauT family transport system substrate-binding protein
MKMTTKKLIGLVLAASLMLGGTGCGVSRNSEDTSATATPAPATQAVTQEAADEDSQDTGELIPVSFQSKWIPQTQFMGYYVALSKGFYEEEGLDVTILPGGSDINVPSVVESGTAQLGTTNLYNLISYQEEGYPLVGLSQVMQDSPFVLVCNKDKISSVEDLRGKTIGAWLGGNDYPIRALLTKYGMDPDTDVTLATQGTTIDGFLDGSFDAYSAMTYNELLLAYENGYTDDDLYLINMQEEGCGMLADMIFCNADWLKDNKETAVKFLRATIKGWVYACQNVTEATDITYSYMDQASANYDHQLQSAERVSKLVMPEGSDSSIVGAIDDTKVQTTLDIALQYEVISAMPSIDSVFDKSVLEEATAQ